MDTNGDVTALLREIRDRQREQVELQRRHLAAFESQLDRIERINARAEALQDRARNNLRLVGWLLVPLALVIAALAFWPAVRDLLGGP